MNLTHAGLGALANGDIENFLVASTPGGIERADPGNETRMKVQLSSRIESAIRRRLHIIIEFQYPDYCNPHAYWDIDELDFKVGE